MLPLISATSARGSESESRVLAFSAEQGDGVEASPVRLNPALATPSHLVPRIVSPLTAALRAITGQPVAPVASTPTRTLPKHPRLLWPASETSAVIRSIAQNPQDAALLREYVQRGQALLTVPPVRRELQGRRLRESSTVAVERIVLLAFLYRVTGDRAYATRAERELLAIAEFRDWNPDTFLDVAQLTAGAAIGYDWLYDVLTPRTRSKVREAIRTKGLAPVFGATGRDSVGRSNNWNAVCNSGATLGALAIYESEPALAERVLGVVRTNAPKGFGQYNGAYTEGPSYWDYGTTYAILMIEALRFNLRSDFGLGRGTGFFDSATFMQHATGPSGKQFNYSDGNEQRGPTPAMSWFGIADDRPGRPGRYDPLRLVWRDRVRSGEAPPLSWQSRDSNPVAFVRTSWDARSSIFVGMKAGHASAPHGHMDAGSFVLDIDGQRWASDLDKRDYHALESAGVDYWNQRQTSPRWRVFEAGPFSHNTLTVNGALHNANARATFVGDAPNASIDLSKTLGVSKATRSFRVSDSTVAIVDTIEGAPARADIRWAMTTSAAITVRGNTATLRQGGKSITLTFSGTPRLSVEELTQNAPPFRVPVRGYRQLVVRVAADERGAASITARIRRAAR